LIRYAAKWRRIENSSFNCQWAWYKSQILNETNCGQFVIGYMYHYGLGDVEKNEEKAKEYYLDSIKKMYDSSVEEQLNTLFGDKNLIQVILEDYDNLKKRYEELLKKIKDSEEEWVK
jgi:TPR repeat protein